ncbi:MAG: hypothetical protein HZA17_12175 [Nitrospirae bacterium]|nr:hypothetical protein [Nitrospirota bacterium]
MTDTPAVTNNLIDLKLEASRNQPTAGPGLGIVAEIKNISNSTVYLKSLHTTLVLPPELDKQFTGINEWFAFFPTQSIEDVTKSVYDRSILIKPGDTYNVFWTTSQKTRFQDGNVWSLMRNISSIILAELNYLFFSPGEYKISVIAKYWTDPRFPQDNYRLITQSKKIIVSTPQSVIIVGSALGGLIAYFILPVARRRFIKVSIETSETDASPFPKSLTRKIFDLPYGKEILGILGSILLSVIITILLARISETQFLIRVTINDFWGAIAIGFIGNYTGFSFLSKYLDKGAQEEEKKPTKEDTGKESIGLDLKDLEKE